MKLKVSLWGIFVSLFLLAGSFFALPAQASVNNFQFSKFKAEYYLTKNSSGYSEVKVEETFVADFPNYNQNKGIVRAIPAVYQNHPLDFKLISLTRNGQTEPVYSQEKENQNHVIETGTNEYLLGPQEFKFTYTLTNVTQESGGFQEFYWNLIGDQFSQVFGSAEAVVHMSSEVNSSFTGEIRCYAGNKSVKINCDTNYNKDSATATFSLSQPLPPKSSMTVAMQFNQGSFNVYKPSAWQNFIINYALYIIGAIVIFAGVASIMILRKNQTPKSKKALIPEYLPPKDMSVMESSGLVSSITHSVIPAQIIDFAVRHKVRILEKEKKQLFGKGKTYTIELLNTDGLLQDETDFLKSMFSSMEIGSQYTFKNNDYKVGEKLNRTVTKSQTTLLVNKGYLKKSIASKVSPFWVVFVLSFVVSIFVFVAQDAPSPSAYSAAFVIISLITGFIMLTCVSATTIYTEEGRIMQHYLEGLRMYIKLAEADRLKYLQSPSGADRASVNTEDQTNMLKLYERVLPYAVLFNLEKEWSKVLEIKYADASSSPSWYGGGDFSRGLVLGAFVSSFNSSTATSFSAPSSSGGSGISGGFAGGGGGGGGGGGR